MEGLVQIEAYCPHCGMKYEYSESTPENTLRCSNCGAFIPGVKDTVRPGHHIKDGRYLHTFYAQLPLGKTATYCTHCGEKI